MAEPSRVRAAGAVVFRPRKQVLLVHRPKYDDWSFPKGKVDRGEHVATAAVREVEEETGLRIRLGEPLPSQEYLVRSRPKQVDYWVGHLIDPSADGVAGYTAPGEIDEVAWVDYQEAMVRLTYEFDRRTLMLARHRRAVTSTLIVLRHAEARARRSWRRADSERPLLAKGHRQAEALVPILEAFGVTDVHTSSAVRCVDTVAPLCEGSALRPREISALTEERGRGAGGATRVAKAVASVLEDLDRRPGRVAVLCTHRPVLPHVYRALGSDAVALETAGLHVFHRRDGEWLADERHRP